MWICWCLKGIVPRCIKNTKIKEINIKVHKGFNVVLPRDVNESSYSSLTRRILEFDLELIKLSLNRLSS